MEKADTEKKEDAEAKKPRLFYWEEACDAWCPVPFDGEEVPGVLSIEQFDEAGEEMEITFKRFDMTDEEMRNLPEN